MKIIATVTDPSAVRAILECLGLTARPPPLSPAQEREQGEFEFSGRGGLALEGAGTLDGRAEEPETAAGGVVPPHCASPLHDWDRPLTREGVSRVRELTVLSLRSGLDYHRR